MRQVTKKSKRIRSRGVVMSGWARKAVWCIAALLITFNAQAETYYFHNDHLGTPQTVTDSTQQIVWRGDYDPFGKVTETVALVDQSIRFPGQYFDKETQLHYNYFRTYDSAIGRYIESDPVGLSAGLNTYGYVGGSPLSYSDPYGLAALDFLWSGIYRATGGRGPSQSTIDFAAGFGDMVSFGATNLIRNQLGTNGMVDRCSGYYSGGGYAALGTQLAATGASLALRGAVRGMTQAQMRRGQTAYMKSLYPTGRNFNVHHLNPLKGHPSNVWPSFQRAFGNTAIFPTGALPSSIRHGRMNISKVSTGAHTYLHKRLMASEAFAKTFFNPITLPVRGAIATNQCGC